MTKSRKSPERYTEIVEDFEDFGYEVQNQKRYSSRSKRQAKFKDSDEYFDDYSH